MHFSYAIISSALALGVIAGPITERSPGYGQQRICPYLNTQDSGCIRYTKGFDVTGVVTEIDLTFPQVTDECDCIQECLNRPHLCANYVWKFTTPSYAYGAHRSCTLYSNFNLPSGVATEFDLDDPNNKNIYRKKIRAGGNNPQNGGLVPQAFKDPGTDSIPDPDAVSGPVWTLANGQVQC